jgi:hypothetical protein
LSLRGQRLAKFRRVEKLSFVLHLVDRRRWIAAGPEPL